MTPPAAFSPPSSSVWAYQVLNLPLSATPTDIRLAYKRLSLHTHPDKTGDPASLDLFHRVRSAYEFLTAAQLQHPEHQVPQASQVITDTVDLSDMQQEPHCLSYPCRCGASFVLENHVLSHSAHQRPDQLVVACDGCSLAIKVLFASEYVNGHD